MVEDSRLESCWIIHLCLEELLPERIEGLLGICGAALCLMALVVQHMGRLLLELVNNSRIGSWDLEALRHFVHRLLALVLCEPSNGDFGKLILLPVGEGG